MHTDVISLYFKPITSVYIQAYNIKNEYKSKGFFFSKIADFEGLQK